MVGGHRPAIAVLLLALAAAPASQVLAQPSASEREQIGLTALINRLGLAAPNGTGVAVTQVEAPMTSGGNNYVPNNADPQLLLDTINPLTLGGTTSTHATGVGLGWYGSNGVSPGVATVDAYNANSWMLDVLRIGNRFAPLTETRQVMNHSWLTQFGSTTDAQDAIRRLDLVAKRDGVVIVAAVNNGSGTTMPQFPASMYNGITVGLTSGNSSAGPTLLDPGRSKPDISVPTTTTSVAASWVSGAASILVQTAGARVNAQQPTSIKAAMLAGATKREFDLDNSTPSLLDNWSHTSTQPLDLRHGAGELNIDNSQRILATTEQNASSITDVALTGWDLGTASSVTDQKYFFTIPAGRVAESVSIIATWNRDIAYTQGKVGQPATLTPSLADIDLLLSKATGFTIGSTIDSSNSSVDNVEHIYVHGLTPGHYAISLSSDLNWEYSLAWDVLLAVPGDANSDGLVDAADYTIWADNFLMTGATLDDGDFNGDGIVDGGDYSLWADNFVLGATAARGMAVPEPATASLLAAGLLSLAMFYLRFRKR